MRKKGTKKHGVYILKDYVNKKGLDFLEKSFVIEYPFLFIFNTDDSVSRVNTRRLLTNYLETKSVIDLCKETGLFYSIVNNEDPFYNSKIFNVDTLNTLFKQPSVGEAYIDGIKVKLSNTYPWIKYKNDGVFTCKFPELSSNAIPGLLKKNYSTVFKEKISKPVIKYVVTPVLTSLAIQLSYIEVSSTIEGSSKEACGSELLKELTAAYRVTAPKVFTINSAYPFDACTYASYLAVKKLEGKYSKPIEYKGLTFKLHGLLDAITPYEDITQIYYAKISDKLEALLSNRSLNTTVEAKQFIKSYINTVETSINETKDLIFNSIDKNKTRVIEAFIQIYKNPEDRDPKYNKLLKEEPITNLIQSKLKTEMGKLPAQDYSRVSSPTRAALQQAVFEYESIITFDIQEPRIAANNIVLPNKIYAVIPDPKTEKQGYSEKEYREVLQKIFDRYFDWVKELVTSWGRITVTTAMTSIVDLSWLVNEDFSNLPAMQKHFYKSIDAWLNIIDKTPLLSLQSELKEEQLQTKIPSLVTDKLYNPSHDQKADIFYLLFKPFQQTRTKPHHMAETLLILAGLVSSGSTQKAQGLARKFSIQPAYAYKIFLCETQFKTTALQLDYTIENLDISRNTTTIYELWLDNPRAPISHIFTIDNGTVTPRFKNHEFYLPGWYNNYLPTFFESKMLWVFSYIFNNRNNKILGKSKKTTLYKKTNTPCSNPRSIGVGSLPLLLYKLLILEGGE